MKEDLLNFSKQLHGGWHYKKSAAKSEQHGFTLLELMIVVTIILILIGMAAQRYEKAILHAREAVLAHDLQVMRQAIDNYATDKLNAPQSLDDLVQEHYLRNIHTDPITQQKDWQPKYGSFVYSPDQLNSGLEDVHSNSDRYSEW